MRIAFATLYDPRDVRRGSGTFYFLSRELGHQGHEMHLVGPVDYSHPPLVSRLLKRLARWRGRRYRSFQDVFVARRIGAFVGRRLEELQQDGVELDVLLTNDYAVAGYTPAPCPVAICNDAVFPARYRDVDHPWLENLFWPNVLSCQRVTRRGLRRAILWSFPSDWAVRTALAYGLPAGQTKVERIEFGCNLEAPPSAGDARRRFADVVRRGHLRILFVGNRDWQLKGGDIAVATVRRLRASGIDARLELVGATPPTTLGEGWARVHGVIDKVRQPHRLGELYATSDLLLMPTRAEGFGIAFVEAAAYGLPSLSYDSGTGVNNAVRHGETGLLLPLDSPSRAFAERIARFYREPQLYDRLSAGGRAFYDEVANWPRAALRLARAIAARLPSADRGAA